jgi:selenocysteine lyase/cysteine desulfurase
MGVLAHDSWYSLGLFPRLPYEDQAVRIGCIHYNTVEEIDRLATALNSLV